MKIRYISVDKVHKKNEKKKLPKQKNNFQIHQGIFNKRY
jgi:hypothetical protein